MNQAALNFVLNYQWEFGVRRTMLQDVRKNGEGRTSTRVTLCLVRSIYETFVAMNSMLYIDDLFPASLEGLSKCPSR